MTRNYRVYVQSTTSSPWTDTGIIESGEDKDKEKIERIWASNLRQMGYANFRLEPITYGTPIDRSGE